MIQTIGLIVAAYAFARLLQVPFELKRNENSGWDLVRLLVVAAISAAGALAVGLLTFALLDAPPLLQDSDRSPRQTRTR